MSALFTWLGDKDREAWQKQNKTGGPIPSILTNNTFTSVVVLTNWQNKPQGDKDRTKNNSQQCIEWFRKISPNTTIDLIFVDLDPNDPTDLSQIYPESLKAIKIFQEKGTDDTLDFAYNLSSGTWAMAVSWALISETSGLRGQCLASAEGKKPTVVNIPFDLKYDFLSKDLRDELDEQKRNLFETVFNDHKGTLKIKSFDGSALKNVQEEIVSAASHSLPVLIMGEPGTEKADVAKLIHENSSFEKGEFTTVFCGSDNDQIMEKKFSRMAAFINEPLDSFEPEKLEYIDKAAQGTIYLDEVDALSKGLQSLLLELITKTEQERLKNPIGVNHYPRILASTREDLFTLVEEGKFSEQLFFKLSPFIINLPSLSSRNEDTARIAENMLLEINLLFSQDPNYIKKEFSAAALDFIKNKTWRGNLMELEATVRRSAWNVRRDTISENDFISAAFVTSAADKTEEGILNQPIGNGFEIEKLLDKVRTHYVNEAHKQAKGNASSAYKLIGLKNYQTFLNWYKKFGQN